ncbi:MAG: protein kinase, partial [Hahellaceae bacterium]|nr:protein kinase [Hahellaceae bacterium]
MRVNPAKFTIVQNLSVGSWCRVDRAISHDDGRQVILKSLLDPVPAPAVEVRFRRCFELLSNLDHPNIVRPIAWLDQSVPLSFVLEDNQSIDLLQYIQRQAPEGLALEPFLRIASQL